MAITTEELLKVALNGISDVNVSSIEALNAVNANLFNGGLSYAAIRWAANQKTTAQKFAEAFAIDSDSDGNVDLTAASAHKDTFKDLFDFGYNHFNSLITSGSAPQASAKDALLAKALAGVNTLDSLSSQLAQVNKNLFDGGLSKGAISWAVKNGYTAEKFAAEFLDSDGNGVVDSGAATAHLSTHKDLSQKGYDFFMAFTGNPGGGSVVGDINVDGTVGATAEAAIDLGTKSNTITIPAPAKAGTIEVYFKNAFSENGKSDDKIVFTGWDKAHTISTIGDKDLSDGVSGFIYNIPSTNAEVKVYFTGLTPAQELSIAAGEIDALKALGFTVEGNDTTTIA